MKELIEQAKTEIHPRTVEGYTTSVPILAYQFSESELWKLIDSIITNDREHLFRELAIQTWDVLGDDENGNPNDRDMEMGYDENGLPNSVGLSIYGRTHSEISFTTNKDIQNLKDK